MKQILNTPIVSIYEVDGEYKVIIQMSQGGCIEHEPFPNNLQGLVSAMQLATECLAGKFFPRRVFVKTEDSAAGPMPPKLIEARKGKQ